MNSDILSIQNIINNDQKQLSPLSDFAFYSLSTGSTSPGFAWTFNQPLSSGSSNNGAPLASPYKFLSPGLPEAYSLGYNFDNQFNATNMYAIQQQHYKDQGYALPHQDHLKMSPGIQSESIYQYDPMQASYQEQYALNSMEPNHTDNPEQNKKPVKKMRSLYNTLVSSNGTYHCPHSGCSQSFTRPQNLKSHLRCHLGTLLLLII